MNRLDDIPRTQPCPTQTPPAAIPASFSEQSSSNHNIEMLAICIAEHAGLAVSLCRIRGGRRTKFRARSTIDPPAWTPNSCAAACGTLAWSFHAYWTILCGCSNGSNLQSWSCPQGKVSIRIPRTCSNVNHQNQGLRKQDVPLFPTHRPLCRLRVRGNNIGPSRRK